MHWVDEVARDLLGRRGSHVIASGTSISGQVHIGNAGDVIIGDGIRRSVEGSGGTARILWIMDDMDPLRSIPEQIPASFSRYLGTPDHRIPCPDDSCSSFIEYFATPFLRELADVGVDPEVISSAELYESGRMVPYVEKALLEADRIRSILQEVSGSEKPAAWLPFDPICEECGKITPTQAYEYDPDRRIVSYRCTGGVAGKRTIEGCGHEGEARLTEGKLTWRVDWAARWVLLGVTCEPFGKDHAAAGGSYDTSSRICREVFGYEPPHPVPYEHILVEGAKMSKSKGNVVTLGEMTAAGTAELSRFFFFRTKATKHKDLMVERTLVPLMESYEWTERVYFGREEGFPEREHEEIRRSYELAQLDVPPASFFQVPFTHLVSTVQVAPDHRSLMTALARTGLVSVPEEHRDRFLRKVTAARTFVAEEAPEDMRFTLLDVSPELTAEDAAAVRAYRETIAEVPWTPEELHQAAYTAAERLGLKGGAVFRAVYRCLLGRDRGPRLGFFLASLDRDHVLERLS